MPSRSITVSAASSILSRSIVFLPGSGGDRPAGRYGYRLDGRQTTGAEKSTTTRDVRDLRANRGEQLSVAASPPRRLESRVYKGCEHLGCKRCVEVFGDLELAAKQPRLARPLTRL